jgi:hypothetical protein
VAIIKLQDAHRVTAAATLCDAGADTSRGRTKPGAWIAVAIRAVQGAAGPGTPCTPDALGRMLRARIKFFSPADEACCKRRRIVDTWRPEGSTPNFPIEVVFDHGTGWVGTKAGLYLEGGTDGDLYDVTIAQDVPRNERDPERVIDVYEDPFVFRLTTYIVTDGGAFVPFPEPPPYHQWFSVTQGAAQLAMPGGVFLPLTESFSDYGPRGEGQIPLSAPQIQVSSGIYVTSGAI